MCVSIDDDMLFIKCGSIELKEGALGEGESDMSGRLFYSIQTTCFSDTDYTFVNNGRFRLGSVSKII